MKGSTVKFDAGMEADMEKVLQGIEGEGRAKRFHATNLTPFGSFAIHAKSSATKTLVFKPQVLKPWTIGSYQFDIYVKLAGETSTRKVKTVEYKLDKETIDFVSKGNMMFIQGPTDFTLWSWASKSEHRPCK